MKNFFPGKEPRELTGHLLLPVICVSVVFFLLLLRLWQLQVMGSEHYSELSLNNRVRLVKKIAPRGLIFDRNGTRIAENRPGFDLAIVPEDVSDWPRTRERLTGIVDITSETLNKRFKKAKNRQPFQAVSLKKDLTWEEMARVESYKLKLPGVLLSVGPKRLYPHGEATAHVLGYLGEVNEKELRASRIARRSYIRNESTGKSALEKNLESRLRGTTGGRHVEVDALGRELGVLKRFAPVPGANIHTTLDLPTQLAATEALRGKAGAVVAIIPQTGEILAMVSGPSFDPNLFTSGITSAKWKELIENPMNVLTNRAIQGQYPPASTFKPITAAAALEEGTISHTKKIFSGPSLEFGGRVYRDWKVDGHGEINVHRAIVESSDTFFYQVGLDVGINNISKYASAFGLGEKTGVRLSHEKRGLVPTREWKRATYNAPWYNGETINVSVGQGFVLATPIQLAYAYAALANGGLLMRPRLVDLMRGPGGEIIEEFPPEEVASLPLSTQTISILNKALRGVITEEGGTARGLFGSGFNIAGKTGTSQVTTLIEREKDISKIPYRLRDHGLFVGFAPYEDPKIVVAVIIEHGGFGSQSAAPVALEVIKAYLKDQLPEEPQEPKGLDKPKPDNGTST